MSHRTAVLPDREFAAVILLWDELWSVGRRPAVRPLRRRVHALAQAGVTVAVVSSSGVAGVARLLRPRPGTPGRLLFAAADGGALYWLTGDGLQAPYRRLRLPAPGGERPDRPASAGLQVVLAELAADGVGPGLVLQIGDHVRTARGERLRGAIDDAPALPLDALDDVLDRHAQHRVPSVDLDPDWVLGRASGERFQGVRESLFTVAGGGVGTRAAAEERPPGSAARTLAAGVYTGRGPGEHLLSVPDWTAVGVEPAPVATDWRLDLRTGVLLRCERTAGPIPLRTARFASAARPGVMMLRAEAAAGRLQPGPALHGSGAAFVAGAGGGRWRGPTAGWPVVHAAQCVNAGRDRDVLERAAAYRFGPGAAEALEAAFADGFDALLAEQRATWARRWAAVDVRIPSDPEAQLAVRYALFALWSHTGRTDELALGARGVTGPGEAGHVFWDADVLALPALATIEPAAADAMVRYRLHRLAAARARAAVASLPGARFPGESGSTGAGVTPVPEHPGGRWTATRTGELEEHVTADVAWAAAFQQRWQGRDLVSGTPTAELLGATARYWAARARTGADGRAHIDHVTGPDRYHPDVDDNAYTNVLARWNLRAAAALEPDRAEAAHWTALADALVDGYDPGTGRHEQFAGFSALEPVLNGEFAAAPVAADLLLGAERVATTQLVQQPDALMLHLLVPDEVAPGSLEPDLDYYAPRTAHGSPHSPAISAALLARAGRSDEALRLLRPALRLDLDDLTGSTASGLHITTLAAVWQAVLFGFAGVSVRGRCLHVDPHLPAAWPSLHVRFRALGRDVRLTVDGSEVLVEASGPLAVRHGDGPIARVDSNRPVRLDAARTIKETV